MAAAPSPSSLPLAGPCAGARNDVDSRCAEAERLAQAAVAHQQRLREVKQQLMETVGIREADARVRDRRQLVAAKDAARASYHSSVAEARDRSDIHEAARVWLREIDRLNRQLSVAEQRAEQVARRAAELEKSLPGIELAADAARIAAEAAHVTCLDARRALAACEEEAQRAIRAAAPPAAARPVDASAGVSATAARGSRGTRAITLVLRGDREALLALALRMAEETGVEAGRLQLLLLELREQISARALEENALRFPDDHPFWSQFPANDRREVAASLAAMGYRFDGRAAWLDGRMPTTREIALALSHVGYDPLTLRRPPSREAIESLWQGTVVMVEDFLAVQAPSLELDEIMVCLGKRAPRLTELWDMWGRLRQLLLAPA
jgi:hypothetical protein